MKRFIHTILTVGLLCAGCSEKETAEDPFKGTDNYIFSLVLHTETADYEAEIVGDRISMTIAPGTSLAGAEAEYEHSELATIAPDPAEVGDWNAERQFVVTSHSGAERVYTYVCTESADIHEGDVVLRTQAEVDAFGALGRDIVTGSLIVGTAVGRDGDAMRDLMIDDVSALSGIREIRGNLIINNTVSCETFEMASLERVNALRAGNTENGNQIGNLRYLNMETLSFPKLRSIDGECRIVNTLGLNLVSMPSLGRIGGDLYVNGYGSSELRLDLKALEEVRDFYVLSSEFHSLDLPRLRQAADITLLGNRITLSAPILETAEALDISSVLSADCPALKRCASAAMRIVNDCDFSSLEEVAGDLELPYYVLAEYTYLFPKLETVGGKLSVGARGWTMFPALKRFGGLDLSNDNGIHYFRIDEIDLTPYETGPLGISLMFGFEKLTGPETYDGELRTRGRSIAGFKTVRSLYAAGTADNEFETVEEDCTLVNATCPALRSVGRNMTVNGDCTLPALQRVGRKLDINPTAEVCTLPALEQIGDGSLSATAHCLAIGEDAYLPDLRRIDFPVLKRVRGMLYMNPDGDLRGLKTISAPMLEEVEGTIYIGRTPRYNPSLCSVLETIYFPMLRSAASVEINHNRMLKDFSAFGTVARTLRESRWKVSDNGYNPTLRDMLDGKYIGE